jgi:hypothetical protein
MRKIKAIGVAVLLAATLAVATASPSEATTHRLTLSQALARYRNHTVEYASHGYKYRDTLTKWIRFDQRKYGTRYWPTFHETRTCIQTPTHSCPSPGMNDSIWSAFWNFVNNGGWPAGTGPSYHWSDLIGDTYKHVVQPCENGVTKGFVGGVAVTKGLPILLEEGAVAPPAVVVAAGGPEGVAGIVIGVCVVTILSQ